MFSIEDIKAALINGNKVGFKLFQEAHKKNIFGNLENSPEIKKIIEEMELYTDSIFNEISPKISFKMIREFEKTGNRLIFENAYFQRRKE